MVQAEAMDQIELLSTREAAELVGQSVSTINRWAAEGRLSPAHQGKGIRGPRVFRKTDVEALMEPSPK